MNPVVSLRFRPRSSRSSAARGQDSHVGGPSDRDLIARSLELADESKSLTFERRVNLLVHEPMEITGQEPAGSAEPAEKAFSLLTSGSDWGWGVRRGPRPRPWDREVSPVGVSLPSRRVIRVLSELIALHGCPSALRVEMARSSRPSSSWAGVPSTALPFTTSSPASRTRTPLANASIGATGPMCRTRTSLRIPGGAAHPDRRVAPDLQRRAAPRQPRPGAAAHVSAEVFIRRGVYLRSVYLTGKLTFSAACE